MKNVLMLAVLILGTTVMVNAQTTPVKTAPVKEAGITKHAKHKAERKAKMANNEAVKTDATKVKK